MDFEVARIGSRLDLLHLITREFNATQDIDQALYNVFSAIIATVRVSDASLFLLNAQGMIEADFLISGFEIKKETHPGTESFATEGLLGWIQHHKKGLIIANIGTNKRWHKAKYLSNLSSGGSAICAPIQIPDQLLGIFIITAPIPNHFDNSDLVMLTIIADHAAFALSNARLLKTEQERRQLADTLTSITQTINSTLDLHEVLGLILEQLALVVEYDSSSILLYDENERILAVHAAKGFDDLDDALSVILHFDENSPNFQAILQKKPIVIDDVDANPHWIKSPSSQQIKSWIGAPLVARNKVVGILTVDSHQLNTYSKDTVNIINSFADHAATATANAQTVAFLQNAEATYSALFEDNTDLIIITDYNGFILDVNRRACEILRRPKEAFIQLEIKYINPELQDFLNKQRKRLKAWRHASIDIDLTDAYRQEIPLEIKVRNIQYKGNDCIEWVGRDIAIRKQIEKMRQDLVNMLVHDLRGPLGNLINAVDLISRLMDTSGEDPRLQHILEMAKRSGQTINDMVDSMLDVSRLEDGELPLQRTMTSLKELTETVRDQVMPQITAKKMGLTLLPLPKQPAEVWIDKSLIRRVLINIVGNAIKYTPEKGCVTLATNISASQLCFSVSDTGPGISKTAQDTIFDKFSRVDYSINAPVGVGLGLAFCKLAAEAHNGTISLESDDIPGKGSTFYIKLPLINPPADEE